MKIDILSDIHLDLWINPSSNYKTTVIENIFNTLLSKESEVLIIAGDISHYNSQIKIIEMIAEIYDYKKIFCVLGNHDLYLINNSIKKKYKNSSKNRQQDWYDYKDNNNIIEILNGNIIEYKGIRFGGTMGWYDGTYNAPQAYDYKDPISIWKNTMNDYHYIKGYKDFYEIYEEEIVKVKHILSADIIITHVCPLSHRIAFQKEYQFEESSMFYAFDGEELIDQCKAKYWIFGHSHGQHEFEIYNTKCIMNTLGYPDESKYKTPKIKTIEI